MSDWEYAYAVAHVRALEANLLSGSDIEQMTNLKDEGQVLTYLKERGWGDDAADESSEAMLSAERRKTWALMRDLKVDPKVFEIFSYPDLYHNLKAGIKEACTTDRHPGVFYEDNEYGEERMMQILQDKDFAALPDHMRAAAEEAYTTLLHTRDGQLCDIIIDRAQLVATEEKGLASKEKIIRDYAQRLVAVSDIKITARAAATGKSREFLARALAPSSSISIEHLMNAAASGLPAVIEYLRETSYAGAAAALEDSPSAFERWCDDQIIEAIRPQKYVACTAGPVIAYLLARENEIKMARIILTAKANDLPDEAIRERTREMYV